MKYEGSVTPMFLGCGFSSRRLRRREMLLQSGQVRRRIGNAQRSYAADRSIGFADFGSAKSEDKGVGFALNKRITAGDDVRHQNWLDVLAGHSGGGVLGIE